MSAEDSLEMEAKQAIRRLVCQINTWSKRSIKRRDGAVAADVFEARSHPNMIVSCRPTQRWDKAPTSFTVINHNLAFYDESTGRLNGDCL